LLTSGDRSLGRPHDRGAGNQRLQAAAHAARAHRAAGDDRAVPDLSAEALSSGEHMAINHDAGADAAVDVSPDEGAHTFGYAGATLCDRTGAGHVVDDNRHAQGGGQHVSNRHVHPMQVGRGGDEAALYFDQARNRDAHPLQTVTREPSRFTNLVSQRGSGCHGTLGVSVQRGHLSTNSDFTAGVSESDCGLLYSKTDTQICRGSVVELEQTCSSPTTGNSLSVADFLNNAAGKQVFDDCRDGRFSQSGSARQVCAGDSAATTNDVEDDRAVDLAHRAAIDLPLDVMLHGCSPGGLWN
jgi:hypothetical protein